MMQYSDSSASETSGTSGISGRDVRVRARDSYSLIRGPFWGSACSMLYFLASCCQPCSSTATCRPGARLAAGTVHQCAVLSMLCWVLCASPRA